MASNNPRNGLSARVVEETYLELQKALSRFRAARSDGEGGAPIRDDHPIVELQERVLRFHELLRPYIKAAPGLRDYWEGAVAAHPDEEFSSVEGLRDYFRENGAGAWQIQANWDAVPAQPSPSTRAESAAVAIADGGEPDTLDGWHDALDLSKTTRVGAIKRTSAEDPLDGWYVLTFKHAIIGLRDLDDWEIGEKTERTRGDGFMAGETSQITLPDPEDPRKILTAARMLVECAAELGALAEYQTVDNREGGFEYDDIL